MDGLKLKICGMRDSENIRTVAALCPDYMGFIFYPGSPRFVGPDFSIPADFPASIKRVGVFVNAPADEMIEQASKHRLDIIQLHGGESAGTAKLLKEEGLMVWKVFSIDDSFDFSETSAFSGHADLFLFDTKGKYHGGNARIFNWSRMNDYDQHLPFMLSGGISAQNIGGVSGLEGMNLHGVDVNSGVEFMPGIKDPDAVKTIREFLRKT